MKKFFTIVCVTMMIASSAQIKLSEQMADTAMNIWIESFLSKWSYDQGVVLKGIEGVWNKTGNGKYFRYIQRSMDFFVDKGGNIKTYKQDEFNIDNVNNGRILLLLY